MLFFNKNLFILKICLFFLTNVTMSLPCDKFDGMALALEYDKAGALLMASTRGNGEYGENVTEHIYHVISIPKILKLQTLLKHRIEIRGEVYFPLSEFKKFSEQFDSFRNAVPGTLGRKKVDEAAHILNKFLFCPYDILIFDSHNKSMDAKSIARLCGIKPRYFEKFEFIQKLGFKLVEDFVFKLNHTKFTEHELNHLLDKLFSKKRDHEIDGLVFRLQDDILWEELGTTSHHPRGTLPLSVVEKLP